MAALGVTLQRGNAIAAARQFLLGLARLRFPLDFGLADGSLEAGHRGVGAFGLASVFVALRDQRCDFVIARDIAPDEAGADQAGDHQQHAEDLAGRVHGVTALRARRNRHQA